MTIEGLPNFLPSTILIIKLLAIKMPAAIDLPHVRIAGDLPLTSLAENIAAASYLPLTSLSFEVLLALADSPRHGYGIIQEIEGRTGEPMNSSTGTLYLALQRLNRDGLIEAGPSTAGSRRRNYSLTEIGRLVAAAEAERLAALVSSAHDKKLLGAAPR